MVPVKLAGRDNRHLAHNGARDMRGTEPKHERPNDITRATISSGNSWRGDGGASELPWTRDRVSSATATGQAAQGTRKGPEPRPARSPSSEFHLHGSLPPPPIKAAGRFFDTHCARDALHERSHSYRSVTDPRNN